MGNLVYMEGSERKIIQGIDKDPAELVRYAESECQAWHNARDYSDWPTGSINLTATSLKLR